MDRSTFEKKAEHLRSTILRIGLDFFGSQDDAEDIAQDALMQLWRYCENLDENRNVEALAIRIAKNCCVNLKRRSRLQLVRSDDYTLANDSDTSLTPHEQLEHKENIGLLDEAISHLNPSERNLFLLRQLDGLSTEEISKSMGIGKPSVQSMISTARKKVFNELLRRMNS